MNKILTNKIKVIAFLLLFLISCFFAGFMLSVKAETFNGVDDLSLAISNVDVIVEGNDGINGLEFTISLPADEYELMKKQVGTDKAYASMETGVIIAPSYYEENTEFNVETLFGDEATYDWAEYVNGNYVYSGNKIRVININENYWVSNGDYYTYSGAIVDVLESNEDEIFLSLGYVKLTDTAGLETFKFGDTAYASVKATALSAIAGGQLTDEQVSWVKENWIGEITASENTSVSVVDVDSLDGAGYSIAQMVGESDENYNLIKGFSDFSNVTISLTDQNGDTKTISNKEGCIPTDDVSNLRLWNIVVSCGEYVLWTGSADLYSMKADFLWNDDNTSKSLRLVESKTVDGSVVFYDVTAREVVDSVVDGINTITYTKSGGSAGTWYVWKPLHTKAYYQNFADTSLALSVTLSADGTNRINEEDHVLNQGFIWGSSNYLANVKTTASVTANILLSDILEKWSNIIDVNWGGTWSNRSSFGMMLAYNLHNGGTLSISDMKVTLDMSDDLVQGQESLVDLETIEDKTSFDFTKYISKADAGIIEKYYNLGLTYTLKGLRTEDEIKIESLSNVDLSTVKEIPYVLTVYAYSEPIYTAVMDFYSSSKSAVWTTELSEDTVKAGRAQTSSLGWTNATIMELENGNGYELIDASTITDSAHPLYGKTGKFVKITSISNAEQLTYSVIPTHTKTYYKELLSGKDYILTFDVYATGSYTGMSAIGAYYNKDIRYREYATWRGTAPTPNTWLTYSIPFDSYLLCDSASDSFSGKYFDFENIGTIVNFPNTMFQFEASSLGSEIYFGLPYVDTMPETVYSSMVEKTIDMLGVSTCDLTQLFTEKELQKYNYYGEKYGFDKIFYKVFFANSYSTIIWADENGKITLDLSTIVGTNESGVSVTIADLIENGTFTINGYICDVNNFKGHTNVGVFGSASGCNNNQLFVKTGAITLINRPDQVEVYEIAVADSTIKILREDYSGKLLSTYNTEGNVNSVCIDNIQDLTKSLKINAFRNETEAAQIQIVSKTDIAEYKIVLTDLTSGSNVLSKDNFAIYHLLYTNVVRISAGSVNPTGVGEYPDAILPMDVAIANNVNGLKAGKNQGVWVSLNVPDDQPAGVYTGTFRILMGISVYDVPVTVTVYDYTVAEETRMTVAIGLSYTNILNLETPYEYDEEGNLIVNSSGDKTGTLSQEIIDAYIEYWTAHKLSTGPIVRSTGFHGAWTGYPYDPEALFSFDTVTVNKKSYYAYEWPLRNKDADGNTYISNHVDNRTGHTTHGYPLYLDNVNAYFDGMVELAQNPGVTNYNIPVAQAIAANFNTENVESLFTSWRGSLNEIHDDMPDGDKAYVINQLVLRDVMEIFFVKAMDLHDAGTSVDVFKKAGVYPTWIDEFGINESKTHNAQYLLKYMVDYFPNLADWLARVYADRIGNDEFILGMLDSIRNIRIRVTTNTLECVDPSIHFADFVAVLGQYNTEEGRAEVDNWHEISYGGNGQKWVYTAGNSFPHSSNNIENTVVASRMIGWIMSEYDIEGWLYWASMNSKYMDGIVASAIEPIVGETVKDGDIIKLDDFYNNGIHYGGVAGDGFLIYPGQYYNVTGPIGTIRLETLTDAIEDYDLFYDLKEMYKNAGIEDSFYPVMRRLAEMLYTGVNCKVPDGYTNDFAISRDSLANMIIMARDNSVFADDVYFDETLSKWVFTVIAPSDIASAVKTSVGATFISSSNLTLGSNAGVKMTFEVPSSAIESGYVSIPYDGKTINLSIETLVGTREVEALKWADVDENSTTTYHLSYYSNGAKNTSADIELVTLSEDNAVGGRTSGNYFYVSPVNDSTANLGFSVLPDQIDKETVKTYIGKAKLVFDVYMVTTNIADGSLRETNKVYYKLGKSTNSQTDSHKWFSVSIDFQQIYDNWDTLMITEPTSYTGSNDDWSTSRRALFAVNGNSHSAPGVHTTSYYIGNFRIKHT